MNDRRGRNLDVRHLLFSRPEPEDADGVTVLRCVIAVSAPLADASLLAACGGSSHTTETTSPPSAAPPSTMRAAPAPSTERLPPQPAWSIARARAKYLAFVAPDKRDGAMLVALGHIVTPSNWTKFRDICKVTAPDEERLARQLAAGAWPAKVQSKVDAMVTALSAQRAAYQNCAAAQSAADVIAALSNPGSVSPAAEAVRIALGLPGTS